MPRIRLRYTCSLALAICAVLNLNTLVYSRQEPGPTVAAPSITAQPYFTEPALSPDRKEIAFVTGGDIWTVPVTGGVSALLVSNPANESRPLYSPDGKQLAF